MVGLNEYYRLSGFVVLARLLVGQLDIGGAGSDLSLAVSGDSACPPARGTALRPGSRRIVSESARDSTPQIKNKRFPETHLEN